MSRMAGGNSKVTVDGVQITDFDRFKLSLFQQRIRGLSDPQMERLYLLVRNLILQGVAEALRSVARGRTEVDPTML